MRSPAGPSQHPIAAGSPPAGGRTRHGRPLLLARTGWIIMTVLVVVLDALGVPVLYAHLLTACSGEAGAGVACVPGALSPEQVRLLSAHGLSVRSYAGAVVGLELFTTVIFLAVATLIFWRRAESRIALFCATTLVLFGGTFAGPGSGGPMRALIVLAPFWSLPVDSLRFLGNVGFAALFYRFPSGRWVPRWTRWLMIPWMLVAGAQEVFPSSSVNPGQTGMTGNLLFAGLVCTIVAAQVYRYRAVSTAVERHQTKWVVFGSALGIVVLVVTGLLLPRVTPAVSPLASLDRGAAISLAIVVVPVSVAVAMVRSHLFDIDRLINRTLVYGGLTGIVAGGYILIVGALGALFQTRGNLVIALVGTVVVAAVFQPLRVVLQRVVDRMLFGERDDPYAVVSRLGRRLEATLAPEALLPTIVETVAQALKLPAVAIAVVDGDHLRPAATYGTRAGTPVAFPLTYQGEVIGQLLVTPRAPDEPLTAGDLLLLSDIARQASIAVHATRLTTDLLHSRARLVTTREEERRRLRRDLHDGLGPTLAGLTLKVGAIRNLLSRDTAAADRLLAELTAEIEAAGAEIRRLVYALRPPSLDEHGLVAALRAHAARYALHEAMGPGTNQTPGAVRVVVEAPEVLPRLPAAVEVAAFRIAGEALANVARHARAHTCRVELGVDDALRLEIADDGVGLAPDRRVGVGLVSMRERAEELGGTCEVVSTPGGGTRVRAVLPLAAELPLAKE